MTIYLFIGQFKENPYKLVDNFLNSQNLSSTIKWTEQVFKCQANVSQHQMPVNI